MEREVTFSFTGRDSLSQFWVFLIVTGAGCLPLPLLLWDTAGKHVAIASVVVAVVVAVGLRSSIEVGPAHVVITRRCFFVPYRRYTGAAIEDVWFGGDWREAADAMGVVVLLDGREVHIG